MSAFIVSTKHIHALVQLSRDCQLDCLLGYHGDLSCDELGALLLRENIASVQHRYPQDSRAGDGHPSEADVYRFVRPSNPITPVEGIKLIQCYQYQSCEHDAWERSRAGRICVALLDALISRLPGYEDAEWAL